MKRVVNTAGFTLVEAMIVLAVTGVLFLVATQSWNGKQHANEYQAALYDVRSRLQQAISDVENGYFPSANQLNCDAAGMTLQFPIAGSGGQGTNRNCVFLGKALQFDVLATEPETVYQYSIAAREKGRSLDPASPEFAAPTLAPRLTETIRLMPDLQIVHVKMLSSGSINYRGVAFVSDVGSYKGSELQSGSQVIRVYAVGGSLGGSPLIVDEANSTTGATPTLDAAPGGVQICFKSGGTRNFAVITIGANSAVLDVQSSTAQGSCP